MGEAGDIGSGKGNWKIREYLLSNHPKARNSTARCQHVGELVERIGKAIIATSGDGPAITSGPGMGKRDDKLDPIAPVHLSLTESNHPLAEGNGL